MPPDLYDDELPECRVPILQQLKDGQGMIRSALRVGLAVGCVVGVTTMSIVTAYTSIKGKAELSK